MGKISADRDLKLKITSYFTNLTKNNSKNLKRKDNNKMQKRYILSDLLYLSNGTLNRSDNSVKNNLLKNNLIGKGAGDINIANNIKAVPRKGDKLAFIVSDYTYRTSQTQFSNMKNNSIKFSNLQFAVNQSFKPKPHVNATHQYAIV